MQGCGWTSAAPSGLYQHHGGGEACDQLLDEEEARAPSWPPGVDLGSHPTLLALEGVAPGLSHGIFLYEGKNVCFLLGRRAFHLCWWVVSCT